MGNSPDRSDPPTRELVEKINSLLHDKRSALSAEAAHLPEEARDELKRAHSTPRSERESARAENRAFGLLLRRFAKPEVIDRFGEWAERLFDAF
jgi:hypothetical protein